MNRLPLEGLLVLDVTLARAGPTCVRHLADWGADVIRIDPPAKDVTGIDEDAIGSKQGSDYLNLHRNKRSIRLNLKDPQGLAAFYDLARRADVVVENMRASVKHRLGIGWEDLKAINPRLVYASLSGFGQDGPYAQRAGVDQIVQGMAGLMSITGAPGQGPMRVGIPVADLTAGNLLALAVMMALFDRQRTGVGRWVSTSLLEAQVFMLDFQAVRWLTDGVVATQAGNDHPMGIPTGVFDTLDGKVNIAASSSRMWKRLCLALGHPQWSEQPAWSTQKGRSGSRAEINGLINGVTATQTSAHWIATLNACGVPCGPIYTVDQVFEDPQVKHLDLVSAIDQPGQGSRRLLASPLNFSDATREIRRPTPQPGEHTEEILRWIGYNDDQIAALVARTQ